MCFCSDLNKCFVWCWQNGFTPLHLASQEGHTDMVTLLLERKANVNSRAKNGLTPMHLAAQEDHVPVAEILVKHKAQIDPQTKVRTTGTALLRSLLRSNQSRIQRSVVVDCLLVCVIFWFCWKLSCVHTRLMCALNHYLLTCSLILVIFRLIRILKLVSIMATANF